MHRTPAPGLAAFPGIVIALCLAGCGTAASEVAPDGGAHDGAEGGLSTSDGALGSVDGPSSPGDAGATQDAGATSEGGGTTETCAALQGDAGIAGATSAWARAGANGKLTYATLPTGERLLDFSGAGYRGGGVAIPAVVAARTVSPSGGDDTASIQAALDAVAKLPLAGGVRGAVVLTAGTFQLAGSLSITASGVVLRGSGSHVGGTLVNVTGSPRLALSLAGTGSWSESATRTTVTDAYVPSGARTFHVASVAGLSVGQTVLVDRPVTKAWVDFMGMGDMVRNGMLETWIAVGAVSHEDRTITAIAGDALTLDMPVSDTFDAKYVSPPGVSVAPYTFAGRIEQVGLESMHLVAPKQTVPINQPLFAVAQLSALQNAWVKDVVADEFTTGIVVDGTAKWVTIEDSTIQRTAPIDGSQGYPFDFSVDGQGVLVQRCTASGDNVFSYATQDRANGPNVVLDFTAKGSPINLQPHQRWATGVLLDNIVTPTGGIALMNRGWDGSGHGWAIGFGVLWNGVASGMLVQQPPGAMNWAIGSSGTLQKSAPPGSDAGAPPLPEGIIDSPGVFVTPRSLYLEQLCERLGPAAVHAIGY